MPITSKSRKKKSRAKAVEETKLKIIGWDTTDEDEIELRRKRGLESPGRVENLDPDFPYYSDFHNHSTSGSVYHVEIRSLTERINSCDCPDYQGNQLGTCKHIESVLIRLQKMGKRKFIKASEEGSQRIEIYVDRRDDNTPVKLFLPKKLSSQSQAKLLIEPFFAADGHLLSSPVNAIPAIMRAIQQAPKSVQKKIRFSRHIEQAIEYQKRAVEKHTASKTFMTDVEQGKRSMNVVKHKLYPYQEKGMLHLAFTERALLADEMGLGKTVQAIAACELLRRLHGIKSVLVVATASLKAEWEEQIAKFTGLPSLVIFGSRPDRLKRYQEPAFFYLTNYEQILRDAEDIQRLMAPDVIILDEAQRIKNWKTKTSNAVKKLKSRYAFVLTGTPVENRIDDIYSVVQFLDPHLFGPLFRFNRDFYDLDEKGKPTGYKNLDELHRRLRPVLLRRRKSDVETELPERTVNNYFVEMHPEQQGRYEEYQTKVARLCHVAKKRPLRKEEHERLQRYLACMRMLCDTPYILDEECRISPKLHELESILEEIVTDPDAKIIIFSEWVRMLQLIRELAQKMGLGAAWHTGSVPQHKRRGEINRFKEDPHCRLFLSSDSGSVGLNLQVANVVINVDLPWNPAKLEQRIARAWRKFQTRTVQVINLVASDTIEHRMLGLLEQKQALARGVLHGDGPTEMALPSGRVAFMERMQQLMGDTTSSTMEKATETSSEETQPEVNPEKLLQEDVLSRFEDRIDLLEIHQNPQGEQTVVAVVDEDVKKPREQMQKTIETSCADQIQNLEVLDRQTFETIQRLIDAGVLSMNDKKKEVFRSQQATKPKPQPHEQWKAKAKDYLKKAEHALRMTDVLISGDFFEESYKPMCDALELSLCAYAWLKGSGAGIEKIVSYRLINQLISEHGLSQNALMIATQIRDENGELPKKNMIKGWLKQIKEIAEFVQEKIVTYSTVVTDNE